MTDEKTKWGKYYSAVLAKEVAKAKAWRRRRASTDVAPKTVNVEDLLTKEQWAEIRAGQAERMELTGLLPAPPSTPDMTDEQKEEARKEWERKLAAEAKGRPVDPDAKRITDEAFARAWERRLGSVLPDVKRVVLAALARQGHDEVLPPLPTSSNAREWKEWAAKVGAS
jgi:hypothetical protein